MHVKNKFSSRIIKNMCSFICRFWRKCNFHDAYPEKQILLSLGQPNIFIICQCLCTDFLLLRIFHKMWSKCLSRNCEQCICHDVGNMYVMKRWSAKLCHNTGVTLCRNHFNTIFLFYIFVIYFCPIISFQIYNTICVVILLCLQNRVYFDCSICSALKKYYDNRGYKHFCCHYFRN